MDIMSIYIRIINKGIRYVSIMCMPSAIMVLFTLLLMSCDADSIKLNTSGTVTLHVSFSAKDGKTTRALGSDNEDKVNDITVLVFNSSGEMIGSGYKTFSGSTYMMDITTHMDNGCTVYAIANTHSSIYFNGINTIDELNAMNVTQTSAASLGANSSDAIMLGKQTGVNITTSGNNLKQIAMAHLCSKLNFTIVPASGITITGYQLCSVPLGSYVTDSHSAVTTSPGGYGNFDQVTLNSSTTIASSTYYVYENLTGSNESSTTEASRTSANAPSNATYMLVYAKGATWHATYYIYLGEATSSGATDFTNYNIYRNRNYSYTINIYGMGQSDSRVSWFPEIGEYYYSDGTFGTSASPSGKTVIGVIFSNSTSTTDKSHGWTHGYAMAVKDAMKAVVWGPNDVDTPLPNGSGLSDMDGYTNTQIIKNNYAISTSNYPAFYYALNYGVTAPNNSSGWYLPSCGQWYQFAIALGGRSSSQTTWTGQAIATANSINNYLNNISGSEPFYYDTSANYWFWSSTEDDAGISGIFQMLAGDALINSAIKNYPFSSDSYSATYGGQVRPAIAF